MKFCNQFPLHLIFIRSGHTKSNMCAMYIDSSTEQFNFEFIFFKYDLKFVDYISDRKAMQPLKSYWTKFN